MTPDPHATYAGLVEEADAALHGPLRHGRRHRALGLACTCVLCIAYRRGRRSGVASTPEPVTRVGVDHVARGTGSTHATQGDSTMHEPDDAALTAQARMAQGMAYAMVGTTAMGGKWDDVLPEDHHVPDALMYGTAITLCSIITGGMEAPAVSFTLHDANGNPLDVDDAPPPVRTVTRMLAAVMVDDPATCSALWRAMPDRAYGYAVMDLLTHAATAVVTGEDDEP